MPDVEIAAIAQQIGKAVKQLALRRLVEIDDDVAAEDHIELAGHGPGPMQVQLIEGDERAQRIVHAAAIAVLRVNIFLPQRRRDFTDFRCRIVAFAAQREDIRINVGGQDFRVPARKVGHGFRQCHGDGVGLLPRRAARRPQAQLAAGSLPFDHAWENNRCKMFKMMALAEKFRLVGGERIDEELDLVLAFRSRQQLLVGTEVLEAKGRQAF